MSNEASSLPKIAFTNANLALSPNGLRTPAWMGEFAQDAGYDGVEYHPIWYPASMVGRAAASGALQLTSLHQSFRVGESSKHTNSFTASENQSMVQRVVDSPLGRLIAPELVASAGYIANVQKVSGQRLPAVLYPQQNPHEDAAMIARASASETLFQPTNHVAALVGARSFSAFDSLMLNDRNYDGYCLDTYHVRRRYGQEAEGVVSDLDRSLDVLLSATRALHVSLNRQDMAVNEPHIPTTQELREALDGEFSGSLLDILNGSKEVAQPEYVVVELTSRDLAAVTGRVSLAGLQQDYRTIANNLRSFFAA